MNEPSPPPGPDADLDALRAEIDRLDTQIHDALMQRAEIVAKVAIAKRASSGALGTALRPDREALMAQRIAQAHKGPFPLRSAQRIWREIVGALTQMQVPFTVHLGSSRATDGDAARFAFGDATPVVDHADAAAALTASRATAADLAAIPLNDAAWATLADDEGVLMRAGDMLIVGPRLDVEWDVPLYIGAADAPDAIARAEGASLGPRPSPRGVGGYMEGPWLSPDHPTNQTDPAS